MIETKELISKAEKIHNKNELLNQMDGAMFLHLILQTKSFQSWETDELKRWGYLLSPFYITTELFEEIGGVS